MKQQEHSRTIIKQLSALALLCMAGIIAVAADVRGENYRSDILINSGWKFERSNPAGAERTGFDDSGWENVSLPHTWNGHDGQDGGNDYYRGTGWYRRVLMSEPSWDGKCVYLKFDGAATVAEVFVNGVSAGIHKGNFAAFCYDITRMLKTDGPNIIAIRVSNAKDTTVAPLRGDFTIFGGLYRSVHLVVTGTLAVSPLDDASSGCYVTQKHVASDQAVLGISTVVRNAGISALTAEVRCTVLDASGREVAAETTSSVVGKGTQLPVPMTVAIPNPHLWNGRPDPYLYTIVTSIISGGTVVDDVRERVGVRTFRADPDSGFFLNGRPYALHGVCRHQDRENKGWAIGSAEHREDFALISEMGCTAIRLAHYQHAQEFYHLCDEGGMVVWAELGLVDEINASPMFEEVCRQQLRELIKQNYNHPSIFCWSINNELMPEPDPDLYVRVVRGLNSLAKAIDPVRPTVLASRSKYNNHDAVNMITDIMGYNVYRGWYEGNPEDFAKYIDTLHRRLPGRALCISEYGAGAAISQHELSPKKPNPRGSWHPEEWQSVVHETTLKAMDARPFLWGTFVWNMFDFASDGRSEGIQPGRNDKGLVTYDRKVKKDAFFWYKANWNSDPMVHITSKRFDPHPAGSTDVKVYSNCDSLTLAVDGKVLGTQRPAGHIALWPGVRLNPGIQTLEAVGTRQGIVVKDTCVWHVIVEAARRTPEH